MVGYPANEAKRSTKVAITTSTWTEVVAANAKRNACVVVNDSNEVVYLKFGDAAVVSEGIRLNPAGGCLNVDRNNLYTGKITGITSATETKNVTVTEW